MLETQATRANALQHARTRELHGVQGVGSSNLLAPTNQSRSRTRRNASRSDPSAFSFCSSEGCLRVPGSEGSETKGAVRLGLPHQGTGLSTGLSPRAGKSRLSGTRAKYARMLAKSLKYGSVSSCKTTADPGWKSEVAHNEMRAVAWFICSDRRSAAKRSNRDAGGPVVALRSPCATFAQGPR